MNQATYVNHYCPQCGGDVVFDQEATGTRCRYCGAGLIVLGSRASWLGFLLKPAIPVSDIARHVTRIAMKNGWKPPLLRSVIPFFFPFYRSTGHAIRWVKGERPGPGPWPETAENVAARWVDLMRPAHVDLSPGLFSPGVRAQCLNVFLATRNNAGKVPFLPVQEKREEHEENMEEAFFEAMPDTDIRVREERSFRLWVRNSILFFPLHLVEVREGARIRLLLIDAVGGSLIRQIGHEEMEKLLDNLNQVGGRPPGENRLKLAPLICPECGGDLGPDPMAYVRFCQSCGRGWEPSGQKLRERECHWACDSGEKPDPSLVFLPFWRKECSEGVSHIPAFQVRSPRLWYNLAVRYFDAGFPSNPIPYESRLRIRSLPASLSPDGADEMAEVVSATRAKAVLKGKRCRRAIVMIPFIQKGPDLVESLHGLAVPVSGLAAEI